MTVKANSGAMRRTMLVGTALGCTLGIAPAVSAQNVTYNGPGPYTLTRTDTVSGGPRTVDVTVTSEDVVLDLTRVEVENSTNTIGAGIAATNTGPGNTTVRNGSVIATGTGPTNGIDARAQTGAIFVTSTGTITATAGTSRGINAPTGNGGNITIVANEVNGATRGISTGSIDQAGGNALFATSQVSITSNVVTAGASGVANAILGQGNRVVINAGTTSNTNTAGVQGAALLANAGAGGVLINAGTTSALGQNQAAMQVFSSGVVDVTSGTIRTTQNSDGLSIQTGTDIVVRSTAITTEGTGGARGIVLGGASGGGSLNGGPNGIIYNSATVTSGSISTVGAGAHGIYATPNGAGATTITSGALSTTGADANGIFVTAIGTGTITGPTTINSTGALSVSGTRSVGIRYTPANTSSGAVTINNTGTITASGALNSLGIFVGNANGLTINSNAITTNGSGAASGIQAGSLAASTAGVTITSGTIAITNSGTNTGGTGILVTPSNAGPTTITSGTITNAGSGGGIATQSPNVMTGDITITSGDITLSAPGSLGFRNAIGTIQTAGTLTINSTGTIQSGGAGIAVQARANAAAGAVNITSNVINSFQSGINVQSGSAVTINAATTATSGANQAAIVVIPTAGGTVAINAGSVTTTGANAAGILLGSNTAGTTGITVATANTTASAVDARTVGALTVTSGTARVAGGTATGLTAISSGGDVTLNSTDLGVTNGRGIFAQGLDNAFVTSGTLVTTGSDTAMFAQTSFGQNAGTADGVVVVNSTALTSGAAGINAAGPRAVVTVNSGTLTSGNALGIGAFGPTSTVNSGTLTSQGAGIFASFDTNGTRRGLSTVNSDSVFINGTVDATTVAVAANNQSVTINSGSIVSTGVGNRIGISAQAIGDTALPGDIAITSRDIVTVGNGAYGIQAIASAGAVAINSTGTITTTGTTRLAGTQPRYSAGIIAVAQNGAIAVTSNNITTTGAESDGIRVEAGSGIVSYGQGTIGVAPIAVTTTGLTQTAGLNAAGINILGGGGAVTVNNTGTITATGAGGTGIRVIGGAGAVTVDSATTSASGGDSIFVQSGGPATIRATTATGGGDGGSGVLVTGASVALTVGSASSNGANTTDANGLMARADAIFAEATTGAITAQLGFATATGAGADAVRLIANGANGVVTANVTGTLSSTSGYGLFIDPPGAVIVDVANGARITGALGGINAQGGSIAITNAGTISATNGAAIIAAGPTTIDNRGTIAGSGTTAAQLSASNDVVTLRTGSTVTGAIVGAGGTDAAVLIGAGTVPVTTQTVAGFTGFDSLTVQSGYWTAPATTASTVARTVINAGAALEVQNGATGIAGYSTGTIADNGLLVVRSTAASVGSTFGATAVTGSGNVTFTGAGLTTLAGTNTLANTGTNLIDGGTVLVTGTQGGNFTTAAGGTLQVGTGGTTGVFTGSLANNGTLLVNRSTDVAFNGALTGAGLFVKEGAGRVTFGSGYAFTGVTQLNGGAIRLTTPVAANTELDLRGTGQIDFSGTNQTIAELQGPSALASVNIAGGSLTVNQATSTSFAGSIVGSGSLTKTGTGTLNLTGASTYAGPTAVNGGRLLVNGSIVSPVTVNGGGTLGGTGTVGSTTVAAGGRWAPGNSIGTQTVNGNVSFAPGSILEVETNAAGAADRINASGTATITGGTVQVLAEAGTYARQTSYTILTAAGGVTGRFTTATSNFAFLSPLLGYTSNAVTLTLARNDLAFGAVATGDNQTAVANAIFARGTNDVLFNTVLFQSVTGAQTSFTTLSGELNAGLTTNLVDNGRRVRQAVLDRGAVEAEQGVELWLQGLQSTAQSDLDNGLARFSANRSGVIGGLDYVTAGGIRLGVFGGYQDDDITLRGRPDNADVQTKFAGGSAALRSGALSLQAGGMYAWHDVDTTRNLAGAGFGTTFGSYDATSAQLFAEAGYALTDGPVVVTPFVRNAYTWTRSDAFLESGSTGRLAVARDERDVGLASVGVRVDGTAPLGSATFLPRMAIAYQRGYGDLRGLAVQQFGGTGSAFAVSGASLGKDGLTVDGGFDIRLGGFSLGAGGFASTSGRWKEYGGKASIGLRF